MVEFDESRKPPSGTEAFDRLRRKIRFDVGEHRQTKLNRVLGSRSSSTLLTDTISQTHANRLSKQFLQRWGKLSKSDQLERLRLWTVLGSLSELKPDNILEHVERLQSKLNGVLKKVKGVEVIGAFEIEVVNFKMMGDNANRSEDDEKRKLFVLNGMLGDLPHSLTNPMVVADSYALVHFHGVIDLGVNSVPKEDALRRASKQEWDGSYRVELTKFHANKTVRQNLENIAKYLVKGGNETLIYKIGFGWDSVDDMEREMFKRGKFDSDGLENSRSLTASEIQVLGTAIDKLMGRTRSKNMRNGYLFRYGQQLGRR